MTTLHRAGACAALIATLFAWSGTALACSADSPYISSVCVLAASQPYGSLQGYMLANGAQLSVSQYQALYALIGNSYGGNGSAGNFKLPDLRGRFLVGAGQMPGGPAYQVGQTGGNYQLQLTQNQLPAHAHSLAPATLSQLSTTIDLSKVTGGASSASLANLPFSASGSTLQLMAYGSTAGVSSPDGAALAVTAGPPNKVYAAATPNVTMRAGSIAGNVAGTLSGSAPVTLAGTVTGSVSGTINTGTTTGATGFGQPFDSRPPYLAMYYYIAVNGIYPSNQ